MLTSWIRRAIAVALVAAPVSAFAAGDMPEPKRDSTTVSVNAGQGGFITVPVVRNDMRTYALTGVKPLDSRVVTLRVGQGDVLIRIGN